jgi:hypothetical protein
MELALGEGAFVTAAPTTLLPALAFQEKANRVPQGRKKPRAIAAAFSKTSAVPTGLGKSLIAFTQR